MAIRRPLIKQQASNQNKSGIYIVPDNYIYISHLDENLKFWKLPVYPETISDSMASTFNPTTALGRTAPVYTYSNSGPRTVTFTLKLHRDMMDDANMGFSNSEQGVGEDYLDNLVHALQAAIVPKYNITNKSIEPPLVAVRLGKEIFIKGVLTSSIGLEYSLPILSNDRYAQVSLSLTISEIDPYDATSIYKNGSYRGEVNTLSSGALNYLNIGD